MELIPLVFSSGWASGVNAYLVVLMLGLLGRYTGMGDVPDALMRTDVLLVAAVLYALEFVADKIPYLDSAWDVVSTAIRPTAGVAIALLVSGDATTLEQAVYAAMGGCTALASHTVKTGLRAAVNTSPEPASNVVVSVAEDAAVAGVVILALQHPWWALGVSATLLVLGLVALVVLMRRVRRGWRRWRSRRVRR